MWPAKIIMTLWVIWKKPKMPLIELGLEDAKNAPYLDDGITGDNCIRIETPFNNLKIEFFQAGDINDLIQLMLAYMKAQTENPKLTESGLTLDKIMHFYITFHRLVLTRVSPYNELSEWLKNQKAVINSQNKEEECLKWTVIEAYITARLSIILRELAC